ncbi:MAG: cation transporter [Oscillospiraceae bacterium]|nr:cation transporter [Oscillospiraceae bacterium]
MIQLSSGSKSGSTPESRRKTGVRSGAVGIGLNLLLFVLKLTAGLVSGSVAVLADAFNNLSDAGSALVTLAAFRVAGRRPDAEHPYGHGRMEYVAGLVVSLLILLVGVELLRTSVGRIRTPEPVAWSAALLACLAISIIVKLGMFIYNRRLARRICSAALRAVARDSLADAVSTVVVLLGAVAARVGGWQIDGWLGLVVSLFILYTGLSSLQETLRPLLGAPPDPVVTERIRNFVCGCDGVCGMHDLVVHDYGPGRKMLSLHVEVPETMTLTDAHDLVDRLEDDLARQFHCQAVIHVDPLAVDDPRVTALRDAMADGLRSWDPRLTLHDFRLVEGREHIKAVFDVLAPFDRGEDEICTQAARIAAGLQPPCQISVTVDRPYT